MKILYIILAVILIFGSMLWVLPSPRQRAQMKIRQKAMRCGFTVKLSRVDDPEYPGRTIPCINYSLPREKAGNLVANWSLQRSPRGWIGKGEASGLSAAALAQWGEKLNSQVPGALVLESTPIAVNLYWTEEGDENLVEPLKKFLEEIKAQGLALCSQ